jgi:hypothetical protein
MQRVNMNRRADDDGPVFRHGTIALPAIVTTAACANYIVPISTKVYFGATELRIGKETIDNAHRDAHKRFRLDK